MKLLYIVPTIKDAGGVARILAVKANYFVTHYNYEIHILTQNEEIGASFYDFDSKIVFHDMILKGNILSFLYSYKKQLQDKIEAIKPDVILVADNGLKAFILPLIVKTKIPLVLEIHSSKFIEEGSARINFLSKLKYRLKDFGARKYTKMVVLLPESLNEWKIQNTEIIPNPLWIETEKKAALKNKRVMAAARNSYEKGLDRLLLIWKRITKKYPDWILDVYTDDVDNLKKEAIDLGIDSTVNVYSFTKNIEEKYLDSSIFVLTSRFEAFSMVLTEAMYLGLPCIAFDCPSGPKAIVEDNENGFLIPDGNLEMFAEKLSLLMENEVLRSRFGIHSNQKMKKKQPDIIMNQWNDLLESLIA